MGVINGFCDAVVLPSKPYLDNGTTIIDKLPLFGPGSLRVAGLGGGGECPRPITLKLLMMLR